jgi:hypothetical protein
MSKAFATLVDWAATAFGSPDDTSWRLEEQLRSKAVAAALLAPPDLQARR